MMEKPWIIVPTRRPEFAQNLVDNAKRQSIDCNLLVVKMHESVDDKTIDGFNPEKILICESDSVDGDKFGPGAARNIGIQYVQDNHRNAPLIFMDDDDWYGPKYVEEAFRLMQSKGLDVVSKGIHFVLTIENELWCLEPETADIGYTHSFNGATTIIRKADICPRFPETMLVGEDTFWGKTLESLKSRRSSIHNFCHIRHTSNTTSLSSLDLLHRTRSGGKNFGVVEDWESVVTGETIVFGEEIPYDDNYWMKKLGNWSVEDAMNGKVPFG